MTRPLGLAAGRWLWLLFAEGAIFLNKDHVWLPPPVPWWHRIACGDLGREAVRPSFSSAGCRG